ncbi:hypothetical protein TNCV_1099581 [Trichonephila clavipes]|nr:hypothetical protein TNCV_1099581 [Trichonephila clavipes]
MSSSLVTLKTRSVEVPLRVKSVESQTVSRWCGRELEYPLSVDDHTPTKVCNALGLRKSITGLVDLQSEDIGGRLRDFELQSSDEDPTMPTEGYGVVRTEQSRVLFYSITAAQEIHRPCSEKTKIYNGKQSHACLRHLLENRLVEERSQMHSISLLLPTWVLDENATGLVQEYVIKILDHSRFLSAYASCPQDAVSQPFQRIECG